MSSGLLAIRAATDANSAEQKRQSERKRNILVLINQFLIEQGYVETAERLQQESGGVLNRFAPADNIDLSIILMDYEAYYEMRLDRKPKLIRKLGDSELDSLPKSKTRQGNDSKKATSKKSTDLNDSMKATNGNSSNKDNNSNSNLESKDDSSVAFAVTGNSVPLSSNSGPTRKAVAGGDEYEGQALMLRLPPQFGGDAELKNLAQSISRDIFVESPNVNWDDIVDLPEAKRLLREAVQLPLRYPNLFKGILRPWRGILLHGPPGTGKTLLAKAVATECHTTFFNISASTLVSKWRGDSEKLVRVLFELARHYAPSTIFLDETDAILSSRDGDGGGQGEHEASRRMKTELLIQMDGLSSRQNSETQQVFVLAASNVPWDLDQALLRRLEKRVLVSLPTLAAREQMLRQNLSGRLAADVDCSVIAAKLDGYSGADIEVLCREAAMRPLRRLLDALDGNFVDDKYASLVAESLLPDAPPPKGAGSGPNVRRNNASVTNNPVSQAKNIDVEALMQRDPVSMADIEAAILSTRPSGDSRNNRYETWQRDHGAV